MSLYMTGLPVHLFPNARWSLGGASWCIMYMCMRVCVDNNVASWPKLVPYLALYQPTNQTSARVVTSNPSNQLPLPSTKADLLISAAVESSGSRKHVGFWSSQSRNCASAIKHDLSHKALNKWTQHCLKKSLTTLSSLLMRFFYLWLFYSF